MQESYLRSVICIIAPYLAIIKYDLKSDESVLRLRGLLFMLCVMSQTVWVQACGVVKCCGGLAEDERQQLVGKRPGA